MWDDRKMSAADFSNTMSGFGEIIKEELADIRGSGWRNAIPKNKRGVTGTLPVDPGHVHYTKNMGSLEGSGWSNTPPPLPPPKQNFVYHVLAGLVAGGILLGVEQAIQHFDLLIRAAQHLVHGLQDIWSLLL